MLDPLDRRHILDALRPPAGYDVDAAIGTTYSLDLMTLLTVPLAFALFDWEDGTDQPGPDPLALLEATRRYAGRIHLFCQAGGTCIPKASSQLLYQLEDIVHEVRSRHDRGIFHPKMWFIRFAPTTKGDPVRYRVLCLSRNMTFDRSWDTMLALDGELTDRELAISANHPLGEFVRTLPSLMTRPASEAVKKLVARMHQEIRRVRFDVPPGFHEMRFHPIGIDGNPDWFFPSRCNRIFAMSPFTDTQMINRIVKYSGGYCSLVSRFDQLVEIDPAVLSNCKEKVFYLHPHADGESSAEDEEAAPEALSGLHAKLFITEEGWDASVWTGSANATTAAFSRNVEFLVELVGKRSNCGVKAFLDGEDGKITFRSMLSEFTPADRPADKDPDARRVEELAEKVQRALVAASVTGRIDTLSGGDKFDIELMTTEGKAGFPGGDYTVRIWPINLPDRNAVDAMPLKQGERVTFAGVSFAALTSFFAFHVSAKVGTHTHDVRFVLNIPMSGFPADRSERMLRSILQNKNQVLRLLILLLADANSDLLSRLDQMRHALKEDAGDGASSPLGNLALLEPLLQTLDRHPKKLKRIAALVDDLRKTPDGEALLPAGFLSVWEPVWEVAQTLIHEAD